MKARVLAFILAMLTAACGREDGNKAPLRVGMDFTYPPFQMFRKMPPGPPVATDGLHRPLDGSMWEMNGVSVQLADALAKDLGQPLQIVAIPFRDLIPALRSGRIDLIVSSLSITDKRREQMDFSDLYVRTGLAMLVRHNSPIASLDDLSKPGRKALVRQSTSSHEYVKSRLASDSIEALQESGIAERMVMEDPDAAYVNDQLMLWHMHQRLPTRTRIIPKLLNDESWGIGIRKGDDAMRRRVNAFLSKFRADGGFRRISDRFLAEEQKFLSDEGLPPFFP